MLCSIYYNSNLVSRTITPRRVFRLAGCVNYTKNPHPVGRGFSRRANCRGSVIRIGSKMAQLH